MTFICYLIIMGAAASLAMMIALLGDPELQRNLNPWLLTGLLVNGTAAPLALATIMMRCSNWARLIYLIVYGPVTLVLAVDQPGWMTYLPVGFFFISAMPLLTRKTRYYFRHKDYQSERRRKDFERIMAQQPRTNKYRY
ncbi:MAG: hypothetical protein QM796_07170 [Chthoniobacteraceae bacterium]